MKPKRYLDVLSIIADHFGKRSKLYKELQQQLEEKEDKRNVVIELIRSAIVRVEATKFREHVVFKTPEGTMRVTIEIK